MQDIERAAAIRDEILAMDAQRCSRVINGAEYAAWHVDGSGWFAIVANLWDLHSAACRGSGREPNERADIIELEFLEVHHDGEGVMAMVYDVAGENGKLLYFDGGVWESHFSIRTDNPLEAADIRQAA